MSRYLFAEPVCRLWRVLLAAVFLISMLGAVRGATLVQDFYLPMPEAQISQANNAIVSGSAGNISSTFSILVTGDNTVIYYDQWEDGYETDLSNPTQSTTQIWGDGNDAHGIPPGFAHNPLGLPAGTVITLTNNVTLPRNPSQILWDARDHIAATKALVITRAAWPTSIGPVFAGAVGVLSTLDYGTNYISPVGQNMTNHLFKYVGMFVMAAQDNTSVLIDPNGNGVGTTNVVLNQGESYLINGGIMTGGRVTATKPVEADLVIGDTGGAYASDWFTLYPVQEWSSSYYTPVSSAATQNQPAYVYLFNPNTNSIIINYSTLSGSGSFSVPASNGVVQFQMPVASGAGFTNAAGENFFAICTVAANPQNDTAYNWGFTLVPKAALTTQADVGWGPGSAQTNVDGNPVWVTPVSSTTVYVSYNGGTNGALIDPNGNHYDTNFTLSTLQSQKIYSPTKTQTGMKLYTLNGALITAAWGEDADVAAAGNPYIDAGTTVLPFPVPLLNKTAVIVTDVPPSGLSLGDTILYSVQINNAGLLPLGNTLVIDAPTANLQYVTNSTTFNGTSIPDNTTGQPFPLSSPGFTVPVILSQGTSTFSYMAKVIAPGSVSNSVNIGGTAIFAQAYLPPAITNGASVTVNFTDTNGVSLGLYAAGANVYVTLTNTVADSPSNLTVTVQDLTHGDVENIVLTETGATNNIFRNIIGLPTSTTAGLLPQDGTLNVTPGDTLSVSYTDPTYGDSASNTASIQIPALTKQLYLSVNYSTNGTQDLNRIDPVAYGHGPIHTSIDIGTGSGGGAIGVAASNSVTATTGTTVTVPLNVGSGNNRLLLVGLSGRGLTNTALTFNGVSLSPVGVASNNGVAPFPQIAIWSMVNPPAISNNVVAQFTGSLANGVVVGAVVFTNVNQTTPLSAFVGVNNAATTTGPSITISSVTNQMVFDTFEYDSGTVSTPGTGQTAVFNAVMSSNNGGGGSVRPGAASVTNTWSNATTGHHWAIGAVSIMPATGGGAGGPSTNVTSFAQTPVFCSSFVMPSNNFVTITNYITVTNGVMPANPAVTARLQYNGVNFLTLTNPTYSASASNLIWSAVLSSNITVPAGQAISYVISNGQPNTSFHINYDSTNAQSKITVPASSSTVIAIDTFAVYDGPYPGGNLVTTPTAGSTLYVRATISDPFGSYDITGLGVVITAPAPSADLTTNLSATNIVADDGCTRTYEYPWQTGPTTGNFNIAATASEGTEGITATAATSVSPITLDLGTPNTTEFTSGNDGPATNTYPGGTNGFVCVLVQDLAANTNPAAIQTVTVAVTSSAGDSEIVTLTETSTNTGIFTGCINTSTNGPDVPNDGVLYAPVGSLLTASYTDATYPSETSGANATILPVAGVSGVKITKTIVSPTGGQVGLGLPVEFNLQVINTGSTTLTNVVVTDNFASASLSYSSASLTPTTVAGSSLTWANVGNLAPGQSTNITVTFTALVIGTTTNSATANGVTATNSTSVSLLVSHSALNITKVLLSPTNSPVAVGSNVVFRVLIQNVGNTVIPTLPLEDNFSGAYFQFVSATIPPNGSGYGSLVWTNLASPVALATNAIITNDITMTVVGQGNPANNTAVADYAVDIYGNSVPTATGSTNIVTAAATISGYVYDDVHQTGVYAAGDTPLSGVTIQIYTDPSGTGAPGTLVQETTTSSGGYYELDNLMLGQYVVVETDLPGFANTVPANGRLLFNLTTLTTSSNNYFFQYQPSASLYSTYSGRVIDDVLGTASNTNQPGLANVTVNLVDDINSNGIADPGEPVIYSDTTDANGNYSFSGIVPGHYVIQEIDLYGYYSSGDSQPPNDNQISFVTTNSVTSTTNFFYERLLPTAIPDTNSGFYLVPLTIYPLTNDISPNGDLLTISNAFTTNGILVINPGATNLTFTPTNIGADTIIYTNADAHGGTSSAVITVNVTALADLAVGKSALPTVLADTNLIYTISVTNFGPSGAASVVVTDNVPAGVTFVSASGGGMDNSGIVTWNLGNLATGAVSNVTLTVLAPASGSITNAATIGSPTPDPNLTNNTSPPVATTVTPQADLGIGKTGQGSVLAASNLIYSISVTNFGPSTASGVLVTDTLPVGVTFVSASGGGVSYAGAVIWSLGNLPNGSVSNVTLIVLAPAGGLLTNIATVGSPIGDPNLTNNTTPPVVTTVTPLADLTIAKTGPSTVFAASNLSYTISVTNLGPSSSSGVVVTDTLPVGVTFTNASGGGMNNSGVVNWTLGTLASGQVSNLTVTVTAPASGSLTNVASVNSPTGDPNLTNNVTPPVVTSVTSVADVAIAKTGPATAFAASNLSYAISITNFGPSSASSVVVTDTLPVGVTFVSASGGGVNNSGVLNWTLGTLASGQVSNLTVTVTAPASGSLTNIANVTSPTGDPNLTNNVTPPVVTSVTPVADVVIAKTGPATAFAASNLSYTISVTNFGPSSASSVVVTDTLPVGVTFVSASGGGANISGAVNWSLGILAAGQVSNLTVTVTAPASGSLTNIANVTSPTGDPNMTNNVTPPVVTSVTSVADVAIAKTGPATAFAASNLSYTISVTNIGPSSASSVVVTDTLPIGVTFVSASGGGANISGAVNWSLGTLAAGQVSNLTVIVTAPASGSLTNIANVTSPTGDPNLTNNITPPVVTSVTPVADVVIAKTGPATAFAASNLSYTISVTNFGPSSASSVVVTDTLPVGVTFVSASGGGANNSGAVNWSLGTLAAGQVSNLTVTVTAPASGSLTNVANVTSPTGDPNLTNNITPPVVTSVTPVADVAIAKTGPATAFAASNLSYTISVTNFGPSSAGSVVVTDALPVGVTFVSASGGGANNSGVVNWSLGTLVAGQVSNLTVTVTAPASGSLTNVASVASPTGDTNLLNNVTPPVITTVTPVADVAIAKSGPASAFAATNFTYTISVTNFGPSGAGSVVVTDTLPVGVTFVSASGGGANNSGAVNWSLGTLAAGQVSNLTVTVTAPASGSLTNIANVTSPTGDPNLTNNVTPPVVTSITPVADVAIAKTGPATAFAASNLSYTISVTNFGPSSAGSVVVTDALPVGVIFVGASGGGTNISGVVNWSLGTLAVGQVSNLTVTITTPSSGSLTNTATASSPTGDPNVTNNVTTPVITVVTPVADVTIAKSGPAFVPAAGTVNYTISVTNFGPSSASTVVVTDTLPVGVTFTNASGGGVNNSGVVNWSLGALAAGQVSNLTVTVTAPASGSLTNIASVASPTGDPNLTNNVTPPVITAVSLLADLAVGKSALATVFAASNLTYTISVTNLGPSTASSVVVTDAVPAGASFAGASGGGANNSGLVTWNLGDLANGAISNVTLTVLAPASDSLTNVATVGSPTGDPNVTNNTTPPVVSTVIPLADLTITKTGPATVFAASNFSYTISVTNLGPSDAGGVVVTDTLPLGVTFVSATGSGTNNSGEVSWSLGTLPAGQASNLTVTVTSPAGGSLTNIASVSSPIGDPDLTNNVTPPVVTIVTPVADVSVVKMGPAGMTFNTNFSYTLTVSNAGPSLATGVMVTDSLPAGLVFVSSVPATSTNAMNQVIWSLGNFAAGSGSNLTLTVLSTQRGSLTNMASGGSPTFDPVPTNNSAPPVVTAVTNIPPVAVPDFYAITENTSAIFTPLVNDIVENPGGYLTIVSVNPANGAAGIIGGTNVIFMPTNNFLGFTIIGYTITDNMGGTNNTLITVLVTNIPPVANPDSYSMTENSTNTFAPLVNDLVETPGGFLTIVSVAATNGVASIVNGTNVVFTPTNNFLGTATIGYTITDNVGGTSSSTISVLVTNIPPVANPDFYTMAENTTNTLTPLVNDLVETPGGVLQIIAVSPTNGTATIPNLTNVVFVPTPGFVGIATIGDTITDGIGGTNSSLITVNVTNLPPTAFGQSVSTTENTALPLTLTGFDPAGHALTFIIASGPSGGTLTGLNANTGAVIYTPTNNFTGADSFTFHVNNGYNNSSNATVTIAVTPVADLLVAQSGPTSGVAGADFTFTVAVTNLGPASSTNIIVTNQLAAGFTFVSASDSGATNVDGQVIWTIPVLPPNGATNLTVTMFAVEGGIYTNVASGISITPDLDPTNNDGSLTNAQVITTVSALADVAVFKTGTTNVLAGGTVSYAITATNFGPSTASNVVVSDSLPPGVTLQSASGNYSVSSGVIMWAAALLPAGAATNFTVAVTAPFGGILTNIASSTSDTADPSPGNNDGSSPSSVVITPVTTVADLAIGKSAAASILATSNLVYTISVTNFGPSTASVVTVTDAVPAGATFISASAGGVNNSGVVLWNLGSLVSGTVSNITLTVAAPASGTLTNVATVGSPTSDPNLTNNATPPVITTVTLQADLQIGKTAAVSVLATSNLVYTISVTNFGPSTASSVIITDTVPVGTIFVGASNGGVDNAGVVTWSLANLASNAVSSVTLTVVAPTTGTLTNIATVGSPTGDPNLTNNVTPPVITTVTPQADLQIGKTAAASVLATSNLVYMISVTNFGPSVASGVIVMDAVPVGTTFVSASNGGVDNASVVTWNLGNLASNAVSTVTLTVAAPTTGTLTNIATVGSPTGDPNLTNNVTPPVITTVTPQADLQIGKTAAATVLATSNLVYTISVTNFGPSTASGVIVTDAVPVGTIFVSASNGGVDTAGVVTWNLGNLASNAVSSVILTVTAPTSGTLTNIATVGSPTGDPNLTNNVTPPVTTTVTPQADLQIGKTAAATVLATSNLVYTISVTNFGPSVASGVIATDAVPVGTTFVSASNGGVDNTGVVTWSLGNLASNAVSTVTLTVAAPTSGILTNIATVGSPTGDPNLTNNVTPPVITTVTPQADLQIGKTAAASVLATSNLVYTISVTNFGPSTASGVIVTDAVPAGTSFVSASNGGVDTAGVVTWNLGNLASNAVSSVTLTVAAPTSGTLTNVATVGSPIGDPNLTNNVTPPVFTTITPVADVAIGKSGPAGATFNTNFSYTISVTNFGPSTASGILVTDTLPGGLEFASAVPTTTTNADSQVIWNLGNLAAGGTTNLTLTVISTALGAMTNIASVGSPTLDPSPTNNTSQPVISLATNIPPVANPDNYAISENSGTNVFTPLVNDVVLNPGGTLQLVSVTATNGAAVISGANVLFVPPTNFIGTLTILYTITDNVGGTNGSYITVLVTNIPPVANPATYTVGENSGTASLNPLVNDFPRTPGGVLSLVGLNPTNGAASISGTNVLFTPATNFFGVATIGYTISDGVGGASTSLITANVTNVAPVANAQSVNTAENVPVQITLTGSDPNHLPLAFAIVGNPANGTLSGLNPTAGTVTYTPGTNYTGADSFTFHVNNGQTNSALATVSISITPVADLAVTQSGPATGFAGSNLVFTVVVTNLGPATATSVVVSNQLAAGYTFVSASGGGTDPNNLVIWNFASLPAHGATNFTVTAFATEGGSYTNIASCTSAVLDLNPTNNNGSQANAQAVTLLAPVVDLVVYKIGGTNVYAGAPVNYTVIASNAGPSTATNVMLQDTLPAGGAFQSASGTYSLSNGVVTWSGFTLAPGAVTTFNITLLAAPTVTSFVNIASGSTPAYDPNPTNNNGSYAGSRVNTHVTPSADVIASLSGPTNAIVGSNMVFVVTITNAGPSTASNVVVTDVLLPDLRFVSASGGGTNSSGTNASGTITWPVIPALAAGGETNFTVIARALVAGFFTNIVSSTSTTYDPNPTNNTGVLPAAQAQTQVTLPEFTVLQGAPVFNPQDGLYEEQVTVTNSGSTTVAGIQLYVAGLRSGVSLYNAVGTNNGMPFVEYAFPLNPASTVQFTLEFYDPSRLSFTNTLLVVAYMPTNTVTTGSTNSVAVNNVFEDTRTVPPRIVIEWPSVIGKTYLVIYAASPSTTNWYIATPSITATANITQWYDDGPPETQSPPLSTTSRFYRVIQY